MTEKNKKFRIFLSAAEHSADAHCAALAKQLLDKGNIELIGIGGSKMQAAGVELIEHTTAQAAMLYNVFSQLKYFHDLRKKVRQYLTDDPVDLVIVCDSPAFNFHIAKTAKKLGTKTLFYVAPQLWAWAPWRIRKLKKCCDELCCILPFEKDWFGQRGLETEFVGNPLLENIGSIDNKKTYSNFDPVNAKIALMPGSRSAEIDSLWLPMQQTALSLKEKFPDIKITTVAVDENRKQQLQDVHIEGFECDYSIGSVFDTAKKSDFTIVASGSATLQVAAAGCPMVIMYQSSKLLWNLVGRWIVITKYLSLVNILAQKELVPEFMPYFKSYEPIAEKVKELLSDRQALIKNSSDLIDLVKPLTEKSASVVVSNIAIDMIK
jgi:lipid-A-disaccharide synthase